MKFWYPWSVILCFFCSWTVTDPPPSLFTIPNTSGWLVMETAKHLMLLKISMAKNTRWKRWIVSGLHLHLRRIYRCTRPWLNCYISDCFILWDVLLVSQHVVSRCRTNNHIVMKQVVSCNKMTPHQTKLMLLKRSTESKSLTPYCLRGLPLTSTIVWR